MKELTTEQKIRRAAPPEVVAKLDAQIAADQAAIAARKRNSHPQRLAKAMPSPVPAQQPPARLQREDVNDLYRARVRTVTERFIVAFEKSPWSKPFRQKQANGPMWHDPEAVDKFVVGTMQNMLRALLADELL